MLGFVVFILGWMEGCCVKGECAILEGVVTSILFVKLLLKFF